MYLYSSIIGTFVFNQNFQIREKILFQGEEISKNFELLKEGKQIESEKKFLEKFKSISNLRVKPNSQALEKAFLAMHEYKNEFREANLYLTRKQISASVSEDLLIIQASSAISEINKIINMLMKRLREWYSYSLPEVEEAIEDHKKFAELVHKNSRGELVKEFNVKNSMGKELSREDNEAVLNLASSILELFKEKETKEWYLESLMKKTCPNLTEVAGALIGAKLVTIAGSLREMVMMPASTVQLLGAEKALFKHMVNRQIKPPKHGVIIDHPLLQKAKRENRGKVARGLADKISLAVKVDYFKGKFIGDTLRKGLEEKFR